MNKFLKTILCSLMAVLTAFACLLNGSVKVQAVETTRDKTVINVVFDDSGSMFYDSTKWAQAKYAMEVFAAMLNPDDVLNIFPMSSFEQPDIKRRYFTVTGKETARSRVSKIHDMQEYGGTPIQTVRDAGTVLEREQADHKWLVILSDGELFENVNSGPALTNDQTQSIISEFAGKDGIKAEFIGIGEDAPSLKSTENFQYYRADTDTILSTVTAVATKIFSLQKVDLKGNGPYSFNVDIPVSRMIFFPQGDGADITSLKQNGNAFDEDRTTVDVQVNGKTPLPSGPEIEAQQPQVPPGLQGKVITYNAPDADHPFSSGDYSFDCSVSNVEVYIEPGITFQTTLISDGEVSSRYEIDSVDSLPGGKYRLEISMVDPLTGEILTEADSKYLEGTQLSLSVTSSDGKTETYQNGETIDINPGDFTLRASARFPGNVVKATDGRKITVNARPMTVVFSKPGGYELSLNPLETSEPVTVSVIDGYGKQVPADRFGSMTFETSGTDGISWTPAPTTEPGLFSLTPSFDSDQGALAVQSSKMTLELIVKLNEGSYEQEGSAAVAMNTFVQDSFVLTLDLQMPDDQYPSDDPKYMFNPNDTGPDKSPYILVRVQAQRTDGSSRNLTDEEWEKGVKGFSFKAEQTDSNFLWSLVKWVCFQSINFQVEKGDEPSTYKLYLDGMNPVSILPNTSNLDINLEIKLDNGMIEQGENSGLITVEPLPLLTYIGLFMFLIAIIALIIFLLIMECLKARFKKGICIKAELNYKEHGRPQPVIPIDGTLSISNRFWPPFGPEHANASVEDLDMGKIARIPYINFELTADKTGLVIDSVSSLSNGIPIPQNKISINGTKLSEIVEDGTDSLKIGYNTEIIYNFGKGPSGGWLSVNITRR